MPREGQTIEDFLLSCYLWKSSCREERCQAAPACCAAQSCSQGRGGCARCSQISALPSSRRDSLCQGCPHDSPWGCECTAPAAQNPCQHHTLSKQRWAQRNLPNTQLLLPTFVVVSVRTLRLAACLFVFTPGMCVICFKPGDGEKCGSVFSSLCEWQWLMPFGRTPQGPWDEYRLCLGIG